jgi:hypothetical protein
MPLLDRLKAFFSRETCVRAINFDKRSIEIKVDAEAAGIKFSLADFKTEVQKIREASEFSELLDNYQYQMCRFCRVLGRNDPEWNKYNKIRVGIFHLLTSLQATLIAFKNDPEAQKNRLYDAVGGIQDYILLVAREVMPNIEDAESKSHISKGDVPEVNPRTVSRALEIGGLDETEVNQFIEEVKSE